jgi:hypothetical protein
MSPVSALAFPLEVGPVAGCHCFQLDHHRVERVHARGERGGNRMVTGR